MTSPSALPVRFRGPRRLRDRRGDLVFRAGRTEQALARGATIAGEMAGYGSTCEAFHRVRLEECGEEPARAISLAIEEAGIVPEAIGYLNYHGTSTELNDRIETRAVKLAFGKHAYKLPGSSLKSLIRASARRLRRGGRGSDAVGDARWCAPADRECGCAGPGVRPGLHSRHRPARGFRVRSGELYRFRKQEFSLGFKEPLTCRKSPMLTSLREKWI